MKVIDFNSDEIGKFREASKPVYAEFGTKIGKEFYERMVEAIAKAK